MMALPEPALLPRPAAERGIADAHLIVDLIRVRNTRLPAALYVVAGLALGASVTGLIRGVAVVVLLYAVAAIVNDVFDVQIDRFNGRTVPIADSRISTRGALQVMAAALLLCGFASAGFQSNRSQALVFVALLLSLAYSAPGSRISDRGVLSPLLLAALYGCFPLFLAATEHGGSIPRLGPLTVVFGLAFCTALNKDYTDAPGDEAFGKRTPVVRYGPAAVAKAVVGVLVAVGVVAVATVDAGLWIGAFAVSVVVAVVIGRDCPATKTVGAFRVLATITALAVVGGI